MRTSQAICGLGAAVLAVVFAGTTQAGVGTDRSEFKGYIPVNRMIRARILKAGAGFELGRYLGEEYSPDTDGLVDLMGTFKGAYPSKFRNGSPNGLNMLLWNVIMTGFAEDVSQVCHTPGPNSVVPMLHPKFVQAALALCAWPAPASRTEAVFLNYWTAWMGFDPPEEEFEEWRKFFSEGEGGAIADPMAHLTAMTLGMLLHPEFLLR